MAKKLKRKIRKNVAKGIAHIKATFNNTLITITDMDGEAICSGSAGTVGFKGSRKSTPFAAQRAADRCAHAAKRNGVREIEVRDKGVYLNGKLQSIRGMLTFNDHPDTSRYLPAHIILRDFWIARNANVNAWRHHYPASQEFLELADRYGFLVIESIPLVWDDNLRNPKIVQQAKQQPFFMQCVKVLQEVAR